MPVSHVLDIARSVVEIGGISVAEIGGISPLMPLILGVITDCFLLLSFPWLVLLSKREFGSQVVKQIHCYTPIRIA